MKNLFTFGAVLIAISLMSFASSVNNPIKRVGNNLFEISANAKFAEEDKNILMNFYQNAYNLNDWQAKSENINVEMFVARGEDKKKKCANFFNSDSVALSAVSTKTFRYDCADHISTPQEEKVLAILHRYAAK